MLARLALSRGQGFAASAAPRSMWPSSTICTTTEARSSRSGVGLWSPASVASCLTSAASPPNLPRMADPISLTAGKVDLTDRMIENHTVSASPAAGSITTVATLTWTPASNPAVLYGAYLSAECALTVGTNGVSILAQIRRGTSAGTVIASTGALTAVAASLYSVSLQGVDQVAFVPGQAWVFCLTIGSGSASSTVSSVALWATIV